MKHSKAFCTIITNNYFSWALSLYDSLQEFDEDIILYVAVVDHTAHDHSAEIAGKKIKIITLNDLGSVKFAKETIDKYKDSLNILRWALKPILISKCLESSDKVIFTDADIYFFNSYQFLFDYLETRHILLTPHWRPLTPVNDAVEFHATFRHGIFNAGFIGAAANGRDALEYWAENCYIFCGNNPEAGLFHDQVYLNLIPVYFENILIVKDLGCNIASWNIEFCKRTQDGATGEIKINQTFPVVFIHFTNVTIDKILKGEDGLLRSHLEKFDKSLVKNGFTSMIGQRMNHFDRLIKEQNETVFEKQLKKLKRIYYKIRY
jgi:lipopolysaccharide biosynthesis glycosyltransferase